MQSRRSGCRYLGWQGDAAFYEPMRQATRRQIGYIQSLRAKAGRGLLTDQETADLTISQAYDMIDRLTGKL